MGRPGMTEAGVLAVDLGASVAEALKKLVSADAANAGFQVDLADTYEEIGQQLLSMGRRQDAIDGYRESLDLTKLRFSTGMELRLFLPVFQFPIRFIYAINPRSHPGDKFDGFQFTIGNTY